MMDRRAFLAITAGGLLAAPLAAEAQQAGKVYRVGFLSPSTPAATARLIEGFRHGLQEQGYIEGSSVTIEYRFAEGRFERLPALARELVSLHVDILVAVVTQASLAAQGATSTIPIVMVGVADPVGAHLVATLARPGGNVTGTSSVSAETAGKSLELLREVVPHARRIAVLWNPTNPAFQTQMLRATEAAARALKIELLIFEARDAGAINGAFERASHDRAEAAILLPDPTLAAHARRVAILAVRHRLASVSGDLAYTEAGGLMAYGPSFRELHRGAAIYVARILRGAKPADLPVEQPTKFELVINMKTAKALGLTIPPSLLQRADEVIQ